MVDIAEMQAIGKTFDCLPIPPDAASTEWVPAGPLSIGVEYRDVSSDELKDQFRDAPGGVQELIKAYEDAQVILVDRGVSFHVCDAQTGVEYLRFDAFEAGPDSAGAGALAARVEQRRGEVEAAIPEVVRIATEAADAAPALGAN